MQKITQFRTNIKYKDLFWSGSLKAEDNYLLNLFGHIIVTGRVSMENDMLK
jgi:hypothetical protein